MTKIEILNKYKKQKHNTYRECDVINAMENYLESYKQAQALQLQQTGVMPRFSESEIDKIAFEWSSERSIGDAEQDSQCMYDYSQGMRAMLRLLLNEA